MFWFGVIFEIILLIGLTFGWFYVLSLILAEDELFGSTLRNAVIMTIITVLSIVGCMLVCAWFIPIVQIVNHYNLDG